MHTLQDSLSQLMLEIAGFAGVGQGDRSGVKKKVASTGDRTEQKSNDKEGNT